MIAPMINLPIGIVGDKLMGKQVFASTIQAAISKFGQDLTQLKEWLHIHIESSADKIRDFLGLWEARSLYDSITQLKADNYYISIETPFQFVKNAQKTTVFLAICKQDSKIYLICAAVDFNLFYPFYLECMRTGKAVPFRPHPDMPEPEAQRNFINKFILPIIVQTRIQKNEVQG